MRITFTDIGLPRGGAVVVGVGEGAKLLPTTRAIDKTSGGMLNRAIAASRFAGKRGDWLEVMAPKGLKLGRVLLCGLGNLKTLGPLDAQKIGGETVRRLSSSGEKQVTILLDSVESRGSTLNNALAGAHAAYGAKLASYRFDKYHTRMTEAQSQSLTNVGIGSPNSAGARRSFRALLQVADGVFLTRDLVSEPANVMTPPALAAACRQLEKLGVKVEILDEARLRRLGAGALLGVGQGSAQESQMVVMQWEGAKRTQKPVAFVGKGVTFDTGGISIKPAAGMEEMKWDMGGSGTVIGLMKALAGRKAKTNAVGVVALVENMPSGTAQRPGDVVTSLSGQTIEVLNTDAEGRLILADALWYTQDRFKPRIMIDLATLTGAIMVALGTEYAGMFANDDSLADALSAAGEAEGEKVWRMPLGPAYDKMIESDIADMQNIGKNRYGGASTAAALLQRFVNDVPWAHLDIAGVAWSKKTTATVPKGATGYGVRLLDRLVADQYEK